MNIKTKFGPGDEAFVRTKAGNYAKVKIRGVEVSLFPNRVYDYYAIEMPVDGLVEGFGPNQLMTREEALREFPIDMQRIYRELFFPPELPPLPAGEEMRSGVSLGMDME